ncbi:MAG: A/G-specific adenine glycosylase [Neisseria sp.]|nr:A/G-specific adenine glycosylase [Neisseria sp.]
MPQTTFAARLTAWQKRCGRHGLPWQTRDPYRVWLSEIMLQQTQVATVLEYYPRFVAAFPTVGDLAAAPQDEVLALWQGLGYYSRARNLHKAAGQVAGEWGGRFPDTRQGLETLCGVGRSTAAAVAAFAFLRREAILDGNVKRVLCRVFAKDGDLADKKFEGELWDLAESLLPDNREDMPAYTQGLMDLGATVCKRAKPLCAPCPMADICGAKRQNRIAELPRKKAAPAVKTLPLYWLVLRDEDGAVWLEKRPQGGIWGGLYCVPCFESREDLCGAAAAFGLAADALDEQAEFAHRLTHRLLLVSPFAARITAKPDRHPPGLWVAPQDIGGYGLPQPLAALLAQRQQALF